MAHYLKTFIFLLYFFSITTNYSTAEEPTLPEGLFDNEPLINNSKNLKQNNKNLSSFWEDFEFNGFTDFKLGKRIKNDPLQKDISINELRIQNQIELQKEKILSKISFDLTSDFVENYYGINTKNGRGILSLREAYLLYRPADFIDIKLGRQILTWGVGDLLFLNDLFPKDWNSFFIGRDDSYLKAPSDSIKTSFFLKPFNLDLIYSPKFNEDRFIDGRRISYFDKETGGFSGRDKKLKTETPKTWFTDSEVFIRLYRNISSDEVAFYFYHGFSKSPTSFIQSKTLYSFQKLNVWGLSERRPLLGGIGAVEFSFYDFFKNRKANNPFMKNSELRFLTSFEREILKNLNISVQYYLEHMLKYNKYKLLHQSSPYKRKKDRHLTTFRLQKLLLNQDLNLSFFIFYSPSDKDAYIRQNISYKLNDNLEINSGLNLFLGKEKHTFFSQFEDTSNLYAGIKYSY